MGADDNNMLPLYIGGGLLLFGGFLQLLILVLIPLCLDEDDWKVAYEFDAFHQYNLTPQNSKLKDNKVFIQNYKKQMKQGQNVQEGANVKEDDIEVYDVSDCQTIGSSRQLSVSDENRQLFEQAMEPRQLSARQCETTVKARINIDRKQFDKIWSERQLVEGVRQHLEEVKSTALIKTAASGGVGATNGEASVVTGIRVFSRPPEDDDFKDLLEDDTLYSNKIKKFDILKVDRTKTGTNDLNVQSAATSLSNRRTRIIAFRHKVVLAFPQNRGQDHPRNKDRKGEKYEKDADDYSEAPKEQKGLPDCNPYCLQNNSADGNWGKCPDSGQPTIAAATHHCHPNKYKVVPFEPLQSCTTNAQCQTGGRTHLTCVGTAPNQKCHCTVAAQCGTSGCLSHSGLATNSPKKAHCNAQQTCDPSSTTDWTTSARQGECKLATDRCDQYTLRCVKQQVPEGRRLLTKLMDEHNRNLRGEGFTPVEAN